MQRSLLFVLLGIALVSAAGNLVIASWSSGSNQIDTIYNGTTASGLVLTTTMDGRIVFFESGEIRVINIDGSNLKRIYCGSNPAISNVIGAEFDATMGNVYFTLQGDSHIYSVPINSNCASSATVLLDVSTVGFDGVSSIQLLYDSLYWVGFRSGDGFLVQSSIQNISETPFVVGHDKRLIKTRDFATQADFGQAIYYTAGDVYSFPGGSLNPVTVYSDKKNEPFGVCINIAYYGAVFFTDNEGIKAFLPNVTLVQTYPQGLRLYSLRSAVGTNYPLVSVGLQQ